MRFPGLPAKTRAEVYAQPEALQRPFLPQDFERMVLDDRRDPALGQKKVLLVRLVV